jgi:UDP-3-O-[3-hydroxymyristoyl] glucosamine N-acyltransferase
MALTLTQVAQALNGVLEGDGSLAITGLAGLKEAEPGSLTFLANPRYAPAMAETRASAVIVAQDWQGVCPCALIRVRNPDKAFALAAGLVGPKPVEIPPGIHPTAVIAPDVALGEGVRVGPHCVLEPGVRVGSRTVLMAGCYLGHGSVVGEDCKFYPHVSVRESCAIGSRVILHSGVVVGSDGFGYFMDNGAWKKIPQIGVVEVGDDVELGANVTVDRARFGKTVIGNDVKIDNQVQIAHNVRIGDHTAMAGQVGIAGSTVVGKYVQVGGQAGLGGHLTIGDKCIVGGQSGVSKDLAPGSFVMGYHAVPASEYKRVHAHLQRLPELRERIKTLERRIEALEKSGGQEGGAPS